MDQELKALLLSRQSDIKDIGKRTERLEDSLQQIDQRTNRLEVLPEHDIPKSIQLLAEGYAGILKRLPEAEGVDTLRARIRILERVVADHTKTINELKKA